MAVRLLIFFIKMYQRSISPFLGQNCRFYPTCSDYAVLALQQHGFFKGTMKSIWRILRCNPFNKGGIDYP
ncbi:membrane protein insertion efficiency factor YidD [bacterium]|nr:membrane protein insertion efficiency factor YidD [bacterium]